MKKYRIILKPVGSFGFLGETNKNYFESDSNPTPQVSTIFGMLKEEIIKSAGLYKDNFIYSTDEIKEIEKLVGGFHLTDLYDSNHGIIEQVSPMYYQLETTGKEFYQEINCALLGDKNQLVSYLGNSIVANVVSSFNNEGKVVTDIKQFPEKILIPISQGKKKKDNLKKVLKYDEYIKSFKQQHVSLDYDMHKKINPANTNDRYFVEKKYKAHKDLSFVIDVSLNTDEELDFKNGYVRMGSKSNLFSISYELINDNTSYYELIENKKFKSDLLRKLKIKNDGKIILNMDNVIINPELNVVIMGSKENYRFFNKYTEEKNADGLLEGKLSESYKFTNPNENAIYRNDKTGNKMYQMVKPGSILIFNDTYKVIDVKYGLKIYTKGENNE